jgi:hypothetical protein
VGIVTQIGAFNNNSTKNSDYSPKKFRLDLILFNKKIRESSQTPQILP